MSEKIQLGKTQELIVVKTTDFGVYLNTPGGEDTDKILLPKAQVPKGTQLKDALTVFVYRDSEDRPIATMEEPELELGGVARLKVKEVTKIGAFLEMGGSPGDVYRRSSGGEREGIAAESACLRDPAGRTSRFSYIHLPGVSGTGTTVVGGNFLCNEKQVWTSVTGYGRSVKKNRM